MRVLYKGFEIDVTHQALRKARKKQRVFDPNRRNDISKKQRHRIYNRDGWKCVKCGSKYYLTIDHVIPISEGGPDRENNMQTLCLVCNQRKGSEIISDFIKI